MKRKNFKKIFLAIIIIIISSVVVFLALPQVSDKHGGMVCFRGGCFEVELAITPAEKTVGLMNRDSLDQNRGMLFVFEDHGIRGFWMKNLRFPLDMIFMNDSMRVVYIERNAQPCQDRCNNIIPDKEFRYVLEINGGLSDSLGISEGDQADIFVDIS